MVYYQAASFPGKYPIAAGRGSLGLYSRVDQNTKKQMAFTVSEDEIAEFLIKT